MYYIESMEAKVYYTPRQYRMPPSRTQNIQWLLARESDVSTDLRAFFARGTKTVDRTPSSPVSPFQGCMSSSTESFFIHSTDKGSISTQHVELGQVEGSPVVRTSDTHTDSGVQAIPDTADTSNPDGGAVGLERMPLMPAKSRVSNPSTAPHTLDWCGSSDPSVTPRWIQGCAGAAPSLAWLVVPTAVDPSLRPAPVLPWFQKNRMEKARL